MSPPPNSRIPPALRQKQRRRSWGQLVARLLCLVLGLLGTLPIVAGFWLKSERAQDWVTRETRRVVQEMLAIEANYEVDVQLWPLSVVLSDVQVESTDGQGPALTAERLGVRPRLFALIAGQIDVGDIEIESPAHRLVVEQGEIKNLDFRLPESRDGPKLKRAPFSSLSVTDAKFDLTIDGVHINAGSVDADVFPESGPSYEIALRVGQSWVYVDPALYPENSADLENKAHWDGDVLCQLSARVRVDPDGILVRRLSLLGALDIDPAKDTPPDCRVAEGEDAKSRLALRAHQLRAVPATEHVPWLVSGEIMARLPVDLANRLAPGAGPFTGWVGVGGELRYDGSMRLPQFRGKLRMSELSIADQRLMQGAEGELELRQDEVHVPKIRIQYGPGTLTTEDIVIAPFEEGVRFSARHSLVENVPFPSLMENLAITNNTIVYFNIERSVVSDFQGTLHPTRLDGDLVAEVTQFEIFAGSHKSPTRKHMLGINSRGFTRGIFSIRPDSVQFNNQHVTFGQSALLATVHVGFDSKLFLDVRDSKIDLADISPLVTVPMKGVMKLDAKMEGQAGVAPLHANMNIEGFEFAGLPIGDLQPARVMFRPLFVEVEGAAIKKGESLFQLPQARFDFETGADLEITAKLVAQGTRIIDFLRLWKFDQDPRWREISGIASTSGRLHYVLGGTRDPCGQGNLRVTGALDLGRASLFGETYDGGHADFDFHWLDVEASYLGMQLDVSGLQLKKAAGSLLGNVNLTPGGKLSGNLVATAVPLASLSGTGDLGKRVSGSISAIAEVSGTLDELGAEVQAELSPLIVGRSQLPRSNLHVKLVPKPSSQRFVEDRKTGCGRKIPVPQTVEQLEADVERGVFQVSGQLFGNQILFDDLSITRQDKKIARGTVRFNGLQLGPFLEMQPALATAKHRPTGEFNGRIELQRAPLNALAQTKGRAKIEKFALHWKDFHVTAQPTDALQLEGGNAKVGGLSLRFAKRDSAGALLNLSGQVTQLGKSPTLDMQLRIEPIELAALSELIPGGQAVQGQVSGQVNMKGPLASLAYSGGFRLRDGSLALRGAALNVSRINADLELDTAGVRLTNATANVGGGQLTARGSAPLRGFQLGQFRGQVQANQVSLELAPGIDVSLDASIETTWDPGAEESLPKISGEVSIRSFEYSRPVTMNADISSLTRQAKRTAFESYDPEKDRVALDLRLTSKNSLKLANNLIRANLELDRAGLHLTGTNQRFGLRGNVKVVPGGTIQLRRNEFEIQTGEVRFLDSTRVAPRVDVRAITEYRRFGSTTSTTAAAAATEASSAAGQWRITMHAYGDAENLKLDLSSQPALSQDDIFLLLTIGLTRAELDQAQSASVGESVALEALGSLTGADSAVSEVIPIDEFRFGSFYSPRSGRTEPTVTVGKRLTERIRAYVTSALSESREVSSNLEWRLNRRMTLEGSYDNVNDISSSNIGNIGADVRWRLEFR